MNFFSYDPARFMYFQQQQLQQNLQVQQLQQQPLPKEENDKKQVVP